MRGDSIRDLYAKTLALVGLGLLAGAGALVNYWPVGLSLPAADSALILPAGADALPIRSEDSLRPIAVARTSAGRRFALATAPARDASDAPALPVSESATPGVGYEIGLGEPDAQPAEFVASAGPDRALPAVARYQPLTFLGRAEQLPAPAAGSDDSDGLITGAFKRTGASIVKTGVKTGSSIYGAVRVVGDAVRRAIP